MAKAKTAVTAGATNQYRITTEDLVILIGIEEDAEAPRKAATMTMLKDTGRLIRVSTRVKATAVSSVVVRTSSVVVDVMDPAIPDCIFDPSSRTPRTRPSAEIKKAVRRDAAPEPLRLPNAKEPLFQPNRKPSEMVRPTR